jgi:asparagine synthase (glutamine-hydrolysing)
MHYKINNRETKWVLRKILDDYVPRNILDRPKIGFSAPIENWLRGDLRDWAEDLLGEQNLGETELYDVQLIRKYWKEHTFGKSNWEHQLWNILMLESWKQHWKKD